MDPGRTGPVVVNRLVQRSRALRSAQAWKELVDVSAQLLELNPADPQRAFLHFEAVHHADGPGAALAAVQAMAARMDTRGALRAFARQLEAAGFWRAAAAVHARHAVIADQPVDAQLAQASALLRSDQPAEADPVLRQLAAGAAASAPAARRLLRAATRLEPPELLAGLRQRLLAHPAASWQLRMEQLVALARQGDGVGATETVSAIAATMTTPQELAVFARLLQKKGLPAAAAEVHGRRASHPGQRETALLDQAAALIAGERAGEALPVLRQLADGVAQCLPDARRVSRLAARLRLPVLEAALREQLLAHPAASSLVRVDQLAGMAKDRPDESVATVVAMAEPMTAPDDLLQLARLLQREALWAQAAAVHQRRARLAPHPEDPLLDQAAALFMAARVADATPVLRELADAVAGSAAGARRVLRLAARRQPPALQAGLRDQLLAHPAASWQLKMQLLAAIPRDDDGKAVTDAVASMAATMTAPDDLLRFGRLLQRESLWAQAAAVHERRSKLVTDPEEAALDEAAALLMGGCVSDAAPILRQLASGVADSGAGARRLLRLAARRQPPALLTGLRDQLLAHPAASWQLRIQQLAAIARDEDGKAVLDAVAAMTATMTAADDLVGLARLLQKEKLWQAAAAVQARQAELAADPRKALLDQAGALLMSESPAGAAPVLQRLADSVAAKPAEARTLLRVAARQQPPSLQEHLRALLVAHPCAPWQLRLEQFVALDLEQAGQTGAAALDAVAGQARADAAMRSQAVDACLRHQAWAVLGGLLSRLHADHTEFCTHVLNDLHKALNWPALDTIAAAAALPDWSPLRVARLRMAHLEKTSRTDEADALEASLPPHLRHRAVEAPSPTVSTLMFRNRPLLDALVACARAIIARDGVVRIHVAGCSSGEEAYSLLIALDQAQLLDRARLSGSDVEQDMVNLAASGTLRATVAASLPADLLDRYFVKAADAYRLRPPYAAQLACDRRDLLVPPAAGTGPYDIVLANNVLVHFPVDGKRTMLGNLHRMLAPGGLLCIGGDDHQFIQADLDALGLRPLATGAEAIYGAWELQRRAWYREPRPYWALPPYRAGRAACFATLFAADAASAELFESALRATATPGG